MLINISRSSKINSLQDFLEVFSDIDNINAISGSLLDFDFNITQELNKIEPILIIAKEKHAKEIKTLFMNAYKGTYPFKIMEDEEEIKKMIKKKDFDWFLFRTKEGEIAGCFGAKYNFSAKKGYLHGFVISNKFQKKFDSFKAFIGALVYLWRKFKNKIFIWHGEMRTNNSTTQWCTNYCGMRPVAFFPNKDLFFNKSESEFLHVAYNSKALKDWRVKKSPKIIRAVLNCYQYSNERYNLGLPIIENKDLNVNKEKINYLKKKITIRTETDKFGNKKITYKIKGQNRESFFKFLYNNLNGEIEKCSYEVMNIEELLIFRDFLVEFIKKNKVRYSEIYISAYKPEHQKVFFDAEFNPLGYIPSWNYIEEEGVFYDSIVFVYSDENVNNLKTIKESQKLLRYLYNSKKSMN